MVPSFSDNQTAQVETGDSLGQSVPVNEKRAYAGRRRK